MKRNRKRENKREKKGAEGMRNGGDQQQPESDLKFRALWILAFNQHCEVGIIIILML